MSQNQPVSDTRKLFDPGPLPQDPPRSFAPVALGDIQTARTYLTNALIRLESCWTAGEHFDHQETGSILRALIEIRELVQDVNGAFTVHTNHFPPKSRS